MKKLLSVIVTVAMLISCIAPSMVSFAADESALVIADASFDPAARGADFETAVSIANNPGFCYGVFYLYYENTELNVEEGAVTALVGDDYKVDVTYNCDTTGRTIKNALKAAGVTASETLKCVEIVIEGDANYTGEDLINAVVDLVPGADVSEGDVVTYGIVAGEVVDEEDEDVELAAAVGTATAVADPNTPVYEDKHFDSTTIYADTVTVNKGTTTVEIGFAIDGHGELIDAYGVNSILFRIVYPKELKLISSRLGEVYETSDGIDLDSVKDFGDPSYEVSKEVKGECEWSGYDWANSDDYIVTAMFDDDDPYYQNKNLGYLAYATFEVPAEVGTYEIKVISGPENVFASVYADKNDVPNPELIPFEVVDGAIKVVVGHCDHEAEYLVESGAASTCTEAGWKKVECTNCGQTISEETLALAAHVPGDKVITKAPTMTEEGAYEIACTVCGNVVETGSIPTIDDIYFTVGDGSAKYGDTVLLPITVENNKNGMFIAALDVTFDSAKLTFKGYEGGDIVAADFVNATQYEDGKVRVYFENNEALANIVGDGVLVYLAFEVANDETLAGTTVDVAVSAEADNVIDADGVALSTVFAGGKVTVEAREATIFVGEATGAFGTEVSVPVKVKNNPGMFIGIFEVSYDASVLEYVGFEAATEVFGDAELIYATKTADGKVTLYFENDANADTLANGLLGNLKFVIAEDNALVGEDLAVSIACEEILNYAGGETAHVLVDGKVTVADRAKVQVQASEGKFGKDVLVPVAVVNNEGFFIGSFDVKYDASALTFLGFEGLYNENCIVTKVADGELRVYVEAVENADITADIVIAKLAFAIADDAALVGTELDVTVDVVEMINYAGADLNFAMVDGAVKVLDREKIAVGTVEAEDKHTVNVPVSVIDNPGLWGAVVEFTFDADQFDFVGVESGAFEVVADESYSVNGNVITVFVENADANANVTDDCVLYYLVFAPKANNSATEVTANILEVIDVDGNDLVDMVAGNGTITTIPCDHSEGDTYSEVTTAPTGREEGVKTFYCAICDAVVGTEAIAKLPMIEVGNAEVGANAEVKVPVSLGNNEGVWSIGLEIAYPAEALQFVGVESGLFTVDSANASAKDGVITVFVDAATLADITADGVAFKLVFNTFVDGEYVLDAALIADNTINANGDFVDYVVYGGTVNVCDHTHTPDADAPTCTTPVVCTGCGATLEAATGHNYEAVVTDPTCTTEGYTTYTCTVCGDTYVADVVPATGHVGLVHFDAVDPGCHYIGNVEYWYCPECEGFWLDEACTRLTNSKSVILPATGSENVVHFDAVDPGCHFNGNVEYWYCADCDGFWLDEACTRVTNSKSVILPATGSENVVHFEAVDAGCHSNGHVEYWYCPDCEGFWLDEACTKITNSKSVILPATGSENVVHFEAIEPGCHFNGRVEYWYCADCEGFWLDEACTRLTNSKSVILPATGSENVVHFEAVDAGCHSNGHVEYWYCPDCEGFWLDEACTKITNSKSVILPATGSENVVHFEAIEPACHYNGRVEYWFCPDCEGFWLDEACTKITNSKSVILPATGSENVVHVEAVAATCFSEGNIEYWYCEDCEQFWTDEALTKITNSKSVILPVLEHQNVVHFEAVDAGCHSNGHVEYWYCPDCEGFWLDEACTRVTNSKSVILPATGSENVVHFEAVDAGCHSNGHVEYWYCPDCEGFWLDEACTRVTNSKSVILPATGSENVQHVEAVAPSCHANGNVEYWYCPDCEGFWLDEACTKITNSKSVILGATGEHVWADDFTIDVEPANGADGEKSKHCTTEGCDARTEITVIPGRIPGDVDGDGDFTAADITGVIKAMKGNGIADNPYADVDGDGEVTAADITVVIKLIKENSK